MTDIPPLAGSTAATPGAGSRWPLRIDPGDMRRWRDAGVWRNRTIADDAADRAEADPDGIACTANGRHHRFAGLWTDAQALATALWELGVRPGEVISFQLPNWPQVYVINLAAAMLGCVLNPIVPIYRAREVLPILQDAGSRVVFAARDHRGVDHAAMLAPLRQALPGLRHVIGVRGDGPDELAQLIAGARGRPLPPLPRVRPESVKFLMYTSGTTGRAKGVLHSHETMTRALHVAASQLGAGPDTRWLIGVPVTHAAGYIFGIELPFQMGTRTILMDGWDAHEAVRLIDTERVAIANAPTTFLQDLLAAAEQAQSRLPSLRYFSCAGAAASAELVYRAQAAFPSACVFRAYGSTEASMISRAFTRPDQKHLAAETDGQVLDADVRIVDDAGRPLPLGAEGEIVVKGPALFLGYTNPDDMQDAFDDAGYFRMGDLGHLTADNAIVVTGRKKDLIIRGGENLSAKEIEEALERHPRVQAAAAIPLPHPRLGEVICAYVVAAPGEPPAPAELVAFMLTLGMARQKCPERVEFVDALPRTPMGKVQKDVLRQDLAARLKAAPATQGPTHP